MQQSVRFCRSEDGVRIAFGVSGSGPPLVYAPTWMTHLELDWESRAWRPWLEELSSTHTLIRYDLRGCGLSDRTVDDLSIGAWVADLEAVVDAAGLDRFPLFGVCQGAAIAAAFAALHPQRVTRLALFGSYAQGALARTPRPEAADQVEALALLIQTGWGRSVPAFREVFACMLMPEAKPEMVRALGEMERHSATPRMAQRLWLAFHRVDIAQLAPRVSVPTLVLHSRRDAMVPFDEGRRLATLIPDARFVALDSCNHILQSEDPCWPRFWDTVHEFLGEGTDAGRTRSVPFPELTGRERQLLDLVARGLSNAEIAGRLGIAPSTVRNHITSIFAKLGLRRRAEAIVRARDAGLGLEQEPPR